MIKQTQNKILARVNYPHAPELLKFWSHHVPNKINYKGKEFEIDYKLLESETEFKISYTKTNIPKDENNFEIFKLKECQLVQDVLNHVVTTLRTFDHYDLRFKRITPSDSIVIKVEIYQQNGFFISSFEHKPTYEPPIQFKYLFTQLEDHDGLEGFHFAFEDEQLFAIGLLIEANHSLMKNEYNVSVLHCSTAIESCIFPILEKYLKGLLFNKGNSNVKSVMKEFPMGIKYELIFGAVEKNIFTDEENLLERLKKYNKLRNSIIHTGYSAMRDEAFEYLNDASRFIGMVYMQMKDLSE